MVSTVSVINRVNETISDQRIPTLGHLIWWSLESVDVPQSDVEAIVNSLSLGDPKALCPQIEARGAVKKALESLGLRASPQAGKPVGNDERLFYDRVLDSPKQIVVSIRERTVSVLPNGAVNATYVERQQVTYDREYKCVSYANDFMRQEIDAAYTKYVKTYRASEVRRVIQNALNAEHALTVRESGGIYFVPDAAREVVTKLHALCNTIHGASLTSLGIVDSANSRQEMAKVAGEEINAEIQTLIKDLETLKARVGDPEVNVRATTLQARIETFRAVREKAYAYKELVQLEVKDIDASLDKLTSEVEALL